VLRDRGPVAQIAISAPVKLGELERSAGGADHVNGLRNDFLADAVARNDGDSLLSAGVLHGEQVSRATELRMVGAIIKGSTMQQTPLYNTLAAVAGASPCQYRGAETVAKFGDVAREFTALRDGCGVFDLGWRSKFVVTGDDRVRWLNGMVTNNIRDLEPGR